MHLRTLPLVLALTTAPVHAQTARLPESYLAPLAARPLGPANMSGRVTSLAVVEKTPTTQYVGAAGGGVWKSTDGGATWAPLFDDQPVSSVGAVAVAPSDPDVVYVGTGEANARNSVAWGDGVYRSADGGKTWKHVGLKETRHIGRVVVHPTDADTAYVAALGKLWGPNAERGVFKTADGGKTWQHVLKLDADTGCVDLALDPGDPKTLYAAAYRVRRDGFSGGNPAVQFGPKAGIYRTRDAGKTWARLTKGLPTRPVGRVGLSVYRKDPKVVYAVVQTDRTDTRRVPGQAAKAGTDAETGGVFRTDDGGDSWKKVNDLCPRPFYFGQIRVDPTDDQRVWVLGIPLSVSADGGKTFSSTAARGVHVDHHDLWIDPADPKRLVLGNDGGVYHSADQGKTWAHVKVLPLAQFYGIAVDQRKPYRIYGGLQDNGTWGGPSRTADPRGVSLDDWRRVLSADGFQCQVDPTDANTVYAEAQYGRLVRLDLQAGARRRPPAIKPRAPAGTTYRFNWNSPLLLSPHDSKTVYFGGNHLFESTDRGATWKALGPDLTRGADGPTTGHTLTAVAESPKTKGVLWAGSDDGKLHVSRDGGAKWADISAKLPGVRGAYWVTRVECSPFDAGTAYLALDRHRQDDLAPHLFKTTDYGATWKAVSAGLPKEGPVHVVRADARLRGLLFAGTEFGLFASFDDGGSWQRLRAGLPTAAVHDVVIHPRDRELVVATHGRGLFVLDVAPLQEMSAAVLAKKAHLFDVKPAALVKEPAKPLPALPKGYVAPNPPAGAVVYYALKEKLAAPELTVTDDRGAVVATLPAAGAAGVHRVVWDLKNNAVAGKAAPVAAGNYTVQLKAAGAVLTKPVRVEAAE